MENEERDLFRLQHILESISKISQIVKKHKNFKSFKDEWISQDAMIRNFEIIGEAVTHISDHTKSTFPNIEWSKIKGMRNLIAHEYFGVKLKVIWDTAVIEIPKLEKYIREVIASLNQKSTN